MPIYHNNILSVTVPELVDCGVSENTLKYGLQMQRKGLVYCWEHHKDGKRVYVHYDSLKENYKALIKQVLCNGIEPAVWVENQQAARREAELTRLCSGLADMVEVRAEDVKNLADRKLFGQTEIHRIARAAGWLRLWRLMDVKRARKLGFGSIADVQQEMFKQCLNEQKRNLVRFPKPINNERVLDRKAREYSKQGIDCLIAGYFGNVNRENMNPVSHALLMQLAGMSIKLSFEDIGMYYNTEAQKRELPLMTVSAIKHHLNKPKNKRVWMHARHGKYEADQIFQPEITREKPSFADALWSLDGTTMQLYYKDENDKMQSDLYVYFVTDVYSSAIIGYSIAFSETTGMVAEALKSAIDTHGYKPYQLQYDNSSANVSGAIQAVMKNMSRVHFGCKPNHGQSKYVETYIGHFQQRVLRKSEAFKGGNITSPSLNSKANPELLKELKANPDRLFTQDEIIAQFKEAVAEWNNRGESRDKYGFLVGETKMQKYQHEHAERVKLNYFEKISLFMGELEEPYRYTKQGILITLSGKKHKFIVPDDDNIGDFDFSRNNINEYFKVRINPLNPDFITLYQNDVLMATAHEKEKYASCVADMKLRPGDAEKIKRFILKQEQYGYEHAMNEMERQRLALECAGLKATGTGGFGWYDTPKREFNTIQNKAEDVRNGVADNYEALSPELRALMNM